MTVAGPTRRRTARNARLLLVAYLLIPAALVFGPLPVRLLDWTTIAAQDVAGALGAEPGSVTRMDVEAACNVLLFIPVGFLLALGLPRIGAVRLWLVCLAASVAIELLQGLFLSDRTSSLRDIALNGAGAGVGLAAGRALGRRTAR